MGINLDRKLLALVAEGFGCRAWKVDDIDSYKIALSEASNLKGTRVIDVWVDPQGYQEQLKSLRG
jgi:TPP-dependent trihydroxycyclohexane-1,2-dione (THcHDO) dehydratase